MLLDIRSSYTSEIMGGIDASRDLIAGFDKSKLNRVETVVRTAIDPSEETETVLAWRKFIDDSADVDDDAPVDQLPLTEKLVAPTAAMHGTMGSNRGWAAPWMVRAEYI